MATFDDYHGVYFSIQALRMYHPEIMDETEIIIIDNNPDSAHGKDCANLRGHCPNLKYIPFTEYKSTVEEIKFLNKLREILLFPWIAMFFSRKDL